MDITMNKLIKNICKTQVRLTGRQFRKLFFASVVASAGLVFVAVVLLTYLGYIAPWSGRFYSLWDTG